jgi:DNA mismatch endonuclease, patch repair protein
MVDHLTPSDRSDNMRRIRSKNTKPEKAVRSLLHIMGYRFRLHVANLPGKPDIVLKKYQTVVLVHGCFWHHHKGCKRANIPKTNIDYWVTKIERNKTRDKLNMKKLKSLNWKVIVIWECETKKLDKLSRKLKKNIC